MNIYIYILAEIQKLKHSVPKGDKKKKKEVNDRVEALEAELEAQQKAELAMLSATEANNSHDDVSSD